jgi:hypothetical protein
MRPPLRPGDDDTAETPLADQTPVEAGHKPPSDLLAIIDPIPEVDPPDNPFGLNPRELLFVEAFCGAAKFRAAKAYEMAGYKVTGAASRANASRMLTRERIAAAIQARLSERVKAMRIMDGDEALEGISNMGRIDIRSIFPPDSSIAKLPADVADAIKSVTPTKHGYKIEMYDKLRARETMAKVAGRLKETLKVEHTLEDILAHANQLEPGAGA